MRWSKPPVNVIQAHSPLATTSLVTVKMRRAVHYAVLGLAGLAGIVGIVLLVWLVPPALYGYVPDLKDRATAEASTRTGIIAGLAGLAGLGGLAITARTYRLTKQGQITDRYTKAIEQLGSNKLDVRLGGIYALERIAVDSKRDHSIVVEVLSAFVREHSNPTHAASKPAPVQVLSAFLHRQPGRATDKAAFGLATDVQAAVTVLARLPRRPGVSRGDLSGAYLAGARLDRADLSGAHFNDADLSGAHLEFANLSCARLGGADLSGVHLLLTNLSGAQLVKTNLSGVLPLFTNLSGAYLDNADLSGARLDKTVGLTQSQLDSARGDAATRLPPGLRRPDHWVSGEASASADAVADAR